MNAILQANK